MNLPAARLVDEPFGPELKAEGLKSSRCKVSIRNNKCHCEESRVERDDVAVSYKEIASRL
jgi:hypothetical protein